ncbi:MAG: hypothetical protein P8Z79_22065 [Sedimentisphaerales bacterium]
MGNRRKQLEGLRWVPRWASHVGCIKGCLNYLGIDVSDAWLFGATGHAFALNISPGLCPSGPTDWDTSRFLKLGRNIGYIVECIDEYCPKQNHHLRQVQEQAWDFTRRAIDKNHPCYGWELDIPEYFVIYGYDETGYYTLSCALDLGHNRRKWTDRAGGLEGYDTWIHAMEAGVAGRFGLGYNAAVWAESRRFAVEFLKEAQERRDKNLEPLFTVALQHYSVVAQNLKIVSDTYPFRKCDNECVPVDDQARTVIEALTRARDAEANGLDALARLVDSIPAS